MAFLNSIWLWGALAAAGVAVPIIIHLINRFRQRHIDWAAMELLRRAISVRTRQIRLEDLLLLLLRCLAILLIALALARPTLSGSSAKLLLGGQRMGVVIALDGSLSMTHRVGYSRFEKAKQRVKEIFDTLEPGDPVTLVVMGNQPHVLFRNEGYDKQRFEKALEQTSARPEGLNLEACLKELETLVSEIKASSRECYLITDGQVLTWKNFSDPSRRRLQSIAAASKLYFLSVVTENSENLAVARFGPGAGALRKGALVRYDAVVQNFGQKPQRATVSLLADERVVDQRIVDRLDPGQSRIVPLHFWCNRGGDIRLVAQLGPDALVGDNSRYAVAHVHDRIDVLCVDGSPPGGRDLPYQGETFYLLTALVPRRNLPEQSLVVRKISGPELAGQGLGDFDVVILANVPDIRAETVKALYNFVEQGGGLIFFLGDRTDIRVFNPPATGSPAQPSAKESLSPGELVEIVRASAGLGEPGGPTRSEGMLGAEGWSVEPTRSGHPLSRAIESLPIKLLEEAAIQQYYKMRPHPGTRVVLRVSGTHDPLLVERIIGRGKVLAFMTTASRKWADLMIHPAGPILLHEAMTYLTARANERPFTVGQSFALPLPRPSGPAAAAQGAPATVSVRNPAGEESQVTVSQRGGSQGEGGLPEAVVQFDKTNLPGFYEIRQKGTDAPVVVAGNADPMESDVTVLEGRNLGEALSGVQAMVLAEGQDLTQAIRDTRVGRELWREFLLLGLAMLLVESFLARRFTKRMSTDESEALLTSKETVASRSAVEEAA